MEEKYYIYKITNLVNGKVYIGETCTSVSDRFKRHLEKASNCVKLKRAFNKYGKENFLAEQIDHAETQEEAFHKEAFWIEYYNSISNGYNVLPNRYCSNNKPPKKVYCLETKEVFDSIKEASVSKKCNVCQLGQALKVNRRCKTAGGFHWEYVDKENPQKKPLSKNRKKIKIICIETGKIFDSIFQCAKELGIYRSNIYSSLERGFGCKGFHFQFIGKEK